MYYYAYVNSSNICQSVHALPSQITADGYIEITEEQYTSQSVVGKQYVDGEWVNPVYYYAILNENDICTDVVELPSTIEMDTYIQINSLDTSLIGKRYNRETLQWEEVSFAETAAHSTDEINVGTSNDCLTTVLNAKANSADVYTKTQVDDLIDGIETGTGTAGADGEDGGYYTPTVSTDGVLSWTASKEDMPTVASANIKGADGQNGADGADGTTVVVGTVTTGEAGTSAVVQGVLNEETNVLTLNFTIPKGAQGEKGDAGDASTVDAYTKTEVNTLLNGKADSTHSHDGYATTEQLNNKADSTHTHDYAPSTHTHTMSDITGLSSALSGKADSSHTHSEYASSTHTHSGYASSSHTHSNYFSTSGGTITGETNFSGGLVRLKGTQTLFNSGSMITISSNNVETMIAGSAIYSKVAISVSSDERLKENIADVDADKLIEFIKGIDVKSFNYIDNKTDECIGVIAQDLEKSELAKYFVSQREDGYLSVKTSDLVFPLIVAIQALLKK